MILKINGTPIEELLNQQIVWQMRDQAHNSVDSAVHVTQIGQHAYNVCVDGVCSVFTQDKLEVINRIMGHVQDSYMDIIMKLMG